MQDISPADARVQAESASGPGLRDVAPDNTRTAPGTIEGGDSQTDTVVPDGAVVPDASDEDTAAEAGAESGADALAESGPCASGCGVHQSCVSTDAGTACNCIASICAQAGSACQDAVTLATCAIDSDGCPYVDSTSTCANSQSCSGAAPTAACSLTCTSSCSPGQTTCVSGGLASCTQGGNGCWAYGTPAPCSGSHQSCVGSAGAAACACTADPVCTAAAATCANASTVASCAQDSDACFYEASSMPCSGTTPACLNGGCVACLPGATQCASSTQPQSCSSSGAWQSNAPCTNQACVSGACSGVCTPGATQCSNNGVQTCAANGQWGSAVACAGTTPVCANGVCVCSPGTKQCASGGVQTCGSNNQWGSSVNCATGMCSGGDCTGQTTAGSSCQASGAGLTNCGAGSESCCTSLEVSSGTYFRTYANDGSGALNEADSAAVSGFRMDKYHVTVGRFRQFVTAWNNGSGYTPPAGSGKHTHLNGGQGLANIGNPGTYEPGWVVADNGKIAPTDTNLLCDSSYETWTDPAGSQENLPINCVSWYDAYAFCIWDGGFLPSEAEWGYVAAGDSQQREYPWGTAAPGIMNQYAIYGCFYPGHSGSCNNLTNIAPVGAATAGAGLWGQLDMVGEVYQWTLDWSANSYLNPCTDCAYLLATSARTIRGAAFNDTESSLAPVTRGQFAATTHIALTGFRCARTP